MTHLPPRYFGVTLRSSIKTVKMRFQMAINAEGR
jgi:hypothetical protein